MGNNFINDLLEKVNKGESLAIASDQFGSPTSAKELARFILHLIDTNEYGTYHATNKGVCSRYEFAHEISRLANKLSNGSVIVQRYGDIKRGRRTTYKRLKEGYTEPTLPEAVPGDLGLVLPYNTMKSIIEMIEALDNVTPGIANEHTLLYGVEAKFYSARPKVRDGFESEIDDLYVAGDGAGLTRGLAQAGANGILVARHIVENIK